MRGKKARVRAIGSFHVIHSQAPPSPRSAATLDPPRPYRTRPARPLAIPQSLRCGIYWLPDRRVTALLQFLVAFGLRAVRQGGIAAGEAVFCSHLPTVRHQCVGRRRR